MQKPRRWRLWKAHFDGRRLDWLTPVFFLTLSFGGDNWMCRTIWYGIQLSWKYNKEAKEGTFIFLKEWKFVFREYTYEFIFDRQPELLGVDYGTQIDTLD